jgi:sarcosine oxidase subunit alpha
MAQATRFLHPPSGDFTRDDPITLFFDGRRIRARGGDTIAGAIVGSGIDVLSRSIKYGRPRGYRCGRGRCVHCLVEVNGEPNVRACVTPARDGDRVALQDFHPASGKLLRPLLATFSRFFPTGFYYRWFTRPAILNRIFMKQLRDQTGVGRADARRERAHSPPGAERRIESEIETGVAVVGAGLSGMAAALEAARAGRRVVLLDEYDRVGGHARLEEGCGADIAGAFERARSLADAVRGDERIRVLTGTSAVGYYDERTLALLHGDALSELHFEKLVVATGANDGAPSFGNADLPGILGPRALRLLVNRDGVSPGTRAILTGGTRESLAAAGLLRAIGVRVEAVLWPREPIGGHVPADAERHLERLERDGVRVLRDHAPVAASGRERVTSLTVTPLAAPLVDADGRAAEPEVDVSRSLTLDCDLVVTCAPSRPSFELPHQAGCETTYDARAGGFVPVLDERGIATREWIAVVGEAAGTFDPDRKVEEGTRAGAALAERARAATAGASAGGKGAGEALPVEERRTP